MSFLKHLVNSIDFCTFEVTETILGVFNKSHNLPLSDFIIFHIITSIVIRQDLLTAVLPFPCPSECMRHPNFGCILILRPLLSIEEEVL